MKKFFQIVSKKDFLFIAIIFIAVIMISIFQPSNKVAVDFGDDSVDLKTTKFSMNIPYDLVEYIELVDVPDLGAEVDGHNDMIVQTGTWRNGTWGEYHACIELAAGKCIAVHLTDGRTFVISRRDSEETTKVFETFQGYVKNG